MASTKREGGAGTKERPSDVAKRPPLYKCVLLNDDFTTMEFVVGILMGVFHHTEPVAQSIMLDIHKKGRGIAGVYTREIAETRCALVVQAARREEFPLQAVIEEE